MCDKEKARRKRPTARWAVKSRNQLLFCVFLFSFCSGDLVCEQLQHPPPCVPCTRALWFSAVSDCSLGSRVMRGRGEWPSMGKERNGGSWDGGFPAGSAFPGSRNELAIRPNDSQFRERLRGVGPLRATASLPGRPIHRLS